MSVESVNMSKINNKAVALLSGGLDSRLAVKLVIEQGIDITCLNLVSCFCTCTSKNSCKSEARKAAQQFNLPIKVKNTTMDLIEIVKNPAHGYGRNLNPCIDCRLLLIKEAKKLMRQLGASFIVTGEVLGSRPMSQRFEALKLIEKESGLEGLIVRPLSAKLLPATLPEKQGILERNKFLSIQGRSRKPQIELAEEKHVNDYPCPAGGCLLTDKGFSERLRGLLKTKPNPSLKEIHLLKYGRHFIIDGLNIVIGRNEIENKMIEKLSNDEDTLIKIINFEGPTGLVFGNNSSDKIINKVASIVARYSQGRGEKELTAQYWQKHSLAKKIKVNVKIGYSLVENYRRKNETSKG